MNVKITVSYDGTDYSGWQIQKNGITVQEEIEKAIKDLCGTVSTVTGSGRTDAGVHAEGQVANFKTDFKLPPEKFAPALNARLPESIRILKSEEAADDFNARFFAKRKTYVYSLYVSDKTLPLLNRYAARVNTFYLSAAKEAAKIIKGKHDFKPFSANGTDIKDTVRTIYSIGIKKDGELYRISVTGNGFLYKEVRFIVGTLLAVSENKLTPEDINKIFRTGIRPEFITVAPARGLTLKKVEYKASKTKNKTGHI